MRYCVFSLSTGRIRQVFDAPEVEAAEQLLDGEGIFVGDADPRLHRIVSQDDAFVREDFVDPDELQREARQRVRIELQMLDTQTVAIDGERINCQRTLIEYIAADEGSPEEA